MKAIIPCAGFGTRMRMLPHQAKEMLPDPTTIGLIIDYALNICDLHGFEPIVISRAEKQEFNDYLKSKGVTYYCIEPRGEWMDSVLTSEPLWDENNILILPDTRYNNHFDIFDNIKLGLELGNNAVFGMHTVQDPEKWGIIHKYHVKEKPKGLTGPKNAWGLIGFKKSYGKELFEGMRDYHNFKLNNVGFTEIGPFADITRG